MGEYVGRFAPSPSGALHMGSLLAALASYLQARSRRGRWLVRVEDLDPQREPAGADRDILRCLCAHHLLGDAPPSYQSQRHPLYQHALQQLRQNGRLYSCSCSRAELKQTRLKTASTAYDGRCSTRGLPTQTNALRLRLAEHPKHHFIDAVAGLQTEDLRLTTGDFVLRRRDGLYAYQLAVVVDDAAQGITEVVRGADLLDNTARQIHLQQSLSLNEPDYLHLPLLRDEHGQKLSKQNHAPALDNSHALKNLECAWLALGQQPLPLQPDCPSFLREATAAWRVERISAKA